MNNATMGYPPAICATWEASTAPIVWGRLKTRIAALVFEQEDDDNIAVGENRDDITQPGGPKEKPRADTAPSLPELPERKELPNATLKVAEFLSDVYRFSRRNEETKAIDTVYTFIDTCLLENLFKVCNDALGQADPTRMLPSLVYSFLMVTVRAKPLLPARADFHSKALEAFRNTMGPSEADRLLKYA